MANITARGGQPVSTPEDKPSTLENGQIYTGVLRRDSPQPEPETEPHKDTLTRLYAAAQKKTIFQPGQIIRWKNQMRDRKLPKPDGVAVVMETICPPISVAKDGVTPLPAVDHFDIVIGYLDDENELTCDYCSSWRFELVE